MSNDSRARFRPDRDCLRGLTGPDSLSPCYSCG